MPWWPGFLYKYSVLSEKSEFEKAIRLADVLTYLFQQLWIFKFIFRLVPLSLLKTRTWSPRVKKTRLYFNMSHCLNFCSVTAAPKFSGLELSKSFVFSGFRKKRIFHRTLNVFPDEMYKENRHRFIILLVRHLISDLCSQSLHFPEVQSVSKAFDLAERYRISLHDEKKCDVVCFGAKNSCEDITACS